jgi:hypothetical protein
VFQTRDYWGEIVRGGLSVALLRQFLVSPWRTVMVRAFADVGSRAREQNPGAIVPGFAFAVQARTTSKAD